jgi:bifunctional non-homologous end joining protein LigD
VRDSSLADLGGEDWTKPVPPEPDGLMADTRFGSPLILSRVHWVETKLVAEITYLTWTGDNLLRQTVYVGLREDKPADQVRRER